MLPAMIQQSFFNLLDRSLRNQNINVRGDPTPGKSEIQYRINGPFQQDAGRIDTIALISFGITAEFGRGSCAGPNTLKYLRLTVYSSYNL